MKQQNTGEQPYFLLNTTSEAECDPVVGMVASVCGQPRYLVAAVYFQVLFNIARSGGSGRLRDFDAERLTQNTGIEASAVQAILDAMQGRMVKGDRPFYNVRLPRKATTNG